MQHINIYLQHDAVCLQTNGAVRSIVRKKAATCLLRLIRKSPPEAEILQPDVWSVKLVSPACLQRSNHHQHASHYCCMQLALLE